MEPRCVECGFPIKTLFVQYSPGNIRLMRCENCKAVADEYIECEFMIILIDLILHKTKAYRHILFNVINQHTVNFEGSLWKSIFAFLLLDGCIRSHIDRSLLLKRNEGEWGSSMSFSSIVWTFEEVSKCRWALGINFSFKVGVGFSVVLEKCKDILVAVLVSSYFKIFLIATMVWLPKKHIDDTFTLSASVIFLVWEFPPSVIFIIDLFVLSSNTVALKVITDSAMNRCIAACFCAQALKLLATQVPARRLLRF
ncbi:hypothetical protein POTOM_048206 [Populus tomentosa]|uniref:Protein ARV n=1 Tax=Populus tomentosa TaxID=118781 RepID=A0A8X7YC76_POPTO|nr:hypothetical protein POTOM_048206 [Populus tomentosa]